MKLEAIVAVYADWGIGENGTQPIVVPEDRRHFREVTNGAAVIVGRRTLADFPGGKPLKNRVNIVLTRQSISIPGAAIVHSVQEALQEAERQDRAFVIGGESVYSLLLPHIERIFVTKLDCKPHSDAFFPNLDADAAWRCTDGGERREHDGTGYRFSVYERV